MSHVMSPAEIGADEFATRRARVATAAGREGLDCLLVCARGGGALDRYADVMYLTNHYSAFPFIPDLEGKWTGRAHSFVIVPASGDPLLLTDMPCGPEVAIPREQVVVSGLMLEAVGEALRQRGLSKARIGLVGSDILAVSMYQKIQAAVPEATWKNADHVLANLRAVKSMAEIERLRAAAKIGSRTIEAMLDAARPGNTHGDIVAAGMQVLVPAGGILYNSFMASGKGGDNPTKVSAAFPTWSASTPLKNGDWLRLGISGVLHGYYFDVSRSRAIGPATNRQIDAFEAAISVVEEGIAALRPGTTAGAVATAGLRKQEAIGYPLGNTFDGLGHGIGLGWDSPWLVPQETMKLVPGMVLNFEKTLMLDGYCGDFEETALLTDTGVERLTDARVRLW
jgi:Xaa-Pro aminopeptidase